MRELDTYWSRYILLISNFKIYFLGHLIYYWDISIYHILIILGIISFISVLKAQSIPAFTIHDDSTLYRMTALHAPAMLYAGRGCGHYFHDGARPTGQSQATTWYIQLRSLWWHYDYMPIRWDYLVRVMRAMLRIVQCHSLMARRLVIWKL